MELRFDFSELFKASNEALTVLIEDSARRLENAVRMVVEDARKNSPRYTGQLASSIYYEAAERLTIHNIGTYVISYDIGYRAFYGRYVEYGTGPAIGHKRYWPRLEPRLRQWARHYGLHPYAVAQVIYQRGTKPRNIITNAIQKVLGTTFGIRAIV